jgi:predicted PurR-regulated permease PerM
MVTTPEQRQTLLWLAVGILLAVMLVLLGPILTPFVAAGIIGYILNPGVDTLTARGMPRTVAALIAIAGVGLLIAAIVLIVLPVLGEELPILRQRLPILLDRIDGSVGVWLRQMGMGGRLDLAGIQEIITEKLAASDGLSGAMLNWLRVGGTAVIGWAATLLLIPIVLFYVLLDWHTLFARISETVPRRWIAQVTSIAHEVDSLLAQYLRGQVLVESQSRHGARGLQHREALQRAD